MDELVDLPPLADVDRLRVVADPLGSQYRSQTDLLYETVKTLSQNFGYFWNRNQV